MKKITEQAKEHNSSMQDVKHINSCSFTDFFESSRGNLLINGGNDKKRLMCLAEAVKSIKRTSRKTVVIFSEDRAFEKKLTDMAMKKEIGQLYVINEDYPSYDFFRGMKPNFICEYFNLLGKLKEYKDISEIESYLSSLLSLMKDEGEEINLISLFSFANSYTPGSFLNPYEETMNASSKGGVYLKELLRSSLDAFETLTTENSTGFSLKTAVENDSVILINSPASYHDFFSLYFATELKMISDKSFVCILDGSHLLQSPAVCSVLETLKQKRDITVILSHGNISSVNEGEKLIKNTPRKLIFLHGDAPFPDLQKVTAEFGQYSHIMTAIHENTPPMVLFPFLKGKNEGAVPVSKDRIVLQEESKHNEALLSTSNTSTIFITRKLTA